MNSSSPNARPHDIEQARAEISNLRRDMAKESLQAFTEIYLKRLLPTPYSVMHEEIFKLLDEASNKRSVKLALAAPKGYCSDKLISFSYVLWSICYCHEPFIVLFSHTAKQAQGYLKQIKTELRTNPLLLQDFPDSCYAPNVGREPHVWRRDEIVLPNETRVLALKTKEQIRSDPRSEDHPTLIICDSIESDHPSPDESEQLYRWATGLISHPDMAETNLIVTGVIRTEHSMLERLAHSEICVGWEGRRYSPIIHWAKHKELWFQWERIYYGKEGYQGRSGPGAAKQFFLSHETMMLEGARVLWPACEEYYSLMEQLLVIGALRFFNEKLNEYFDTPVVTMNIDNEPREQDGVIPDAYGCLADRKENKPTRRIPIMERIELTLD